MIEDKVGKGSQGGSLFVCMYCEKYRDDTGFWEQRPVSLRPVSETRISHGICPECLREHFPREFALLCAEGRIAVKEKIMPDNRILYGCFFVVSNRGYLFGENDKAQRI